MTPTIYSNIGEYLKPKFSLICGLSALSLALVIMSILFSPELINHIPNQVPIGISMFSLIVTWGLLITVHGFSAGKGLSPESYSSSSGLKKYAGLLKSWYGSIVLTIWFLSAVTALPWMLWSQYANN